MSRLKFKTQYTTVEMYGEKALHWLYCEHDNVSDRIAFYDEDGKVSLMTFNDDIEDNKWNAACRLMNPYREDGSLSDGVYMWIER